MITNLQEPEEWRAIAGSPGYEVSSLGRVKSPRGVLAPHVNHGYEYVAIRVDGFKKNKTKRVHVLVCEAFIGPRPKGFVSAHGDGNRRNNRASNLRWATVKENWNDARLHGTIRCGKKLTDEVVRAIRAECRPGSPDAGVGTIAKKYGLSRTTITDIVLRRHWANVESDDPIPLGLDGKLPKSIGQAVLMAEVRNLRAKLAEKEAKITSIRDQLKKSNEYISAMDRVIDEFGVAESCINPLEDLKKAISVLVARLASLEAESKLRWDKVTAATNVIRGLQADNERLRDHFRVIQRMTECDANLLTIAGSCHRLSSEVLTLNPPPSPSAGAEKQE